jgi:hypothetical protein
MNVAGIIEAWLHRLAAAGELASLGAEAHGSVARDLGITEGTLVALAEKGPQDQLPRMMRALALDPEQIRRRTPGILRDMEVVCSRCRRARQCRRNLDRGQAGRNFGAFCPNETTLTALREEKAPA